jgi:hypothetical protein
MESSYQSLVSVIIGLISGFLIAFLSAIGFEWFNDYRHKKELIIRILEELSIIQEQVKNVINSESFLNATYQTDVLTNLKPELILKINVKYYRAISETYQKIEELNGLVETNFGMMYAKEKNTNRHMETNKKIDETIKLLKTWKNRRFFT